MADRYSTLAIFMTWLILVIAYAVYYVVSVLTLPDLEGYEGNWSFQLFSFCVARLPFLIIILLLVLFFLRKKN
jgi:hypothetical protein